MLKTIDLRPFGHAFSPQIKQLRLEAEEGKEGIYSIYTKWPDSEDLDDYIRVGYDDNKNILYVDFDSGPFLSIGSSIDNYTIKEFTHDGQFKDIKIVLHDNLD